MKHLAIIAKINEFVKGRILDQLEDLTEGLKEGGLHTFESGLSGLMVEFYNLVAGGGFSDCGTKECWSFGSKSAGATSWQIGKTPAACPD